MEVWYKLIYFEGFWGTAQEEEEHTPSLRIE